MVELTTNSQGGDRVLDATERGFAIVHLQPLSLLKLQALCHIFTNGETEAGPLDPI